MAGLGHILTFRIKPQILNAVFVSAGIIDFPCMDANRLSDAAEILHRTGHNFIGHCNTS